MSTNNQHAGFSLAALQKAGCTTIFTDAGLSSTTGQRSTYTPCARVPPSFSGNVTVRASRFTFPRIPTKMPFRAVFMRGRCRHACMDDLVVDGAPHKVQAAYPLISRSYTTCSGNINHKITATISRGWILPLNPGESAFFYWTF